MLTTTKKKDPINKKYDSQSDFRDTFSKLINLATTRAHHHLLTASFFDTKLGTMLAIADENHLYLLEFVDKSGLENEVKRLSKNLNANITSGETTILKCTKSELTDYFARKNIIFNIPIRLIGTPFQKKVWQALANIPIGETRSYLEVATLIKAPTASRAVARANSTNQLSIIIPCHRVINKNGELGGYAGGCARKQWLLDHEKNLKKLK